jgi:hypothetical protein
VVAPLGGLPQLLLEVPVALQQSSLAWLVWNVVVVDPAVRLVRLPALS